MTLSDKRIFILGGTSGIGLAVAQAAVVEKARVMIASSNSARVAEALAALPPGAEGETIDLTDEGAIKAFFAAAGDFDHLVYTAGELLRLAPLAESDITQARDFFDLRYWGAFTVAKYAHSHIRPGGSIVFTSGSAGARPHEGWSIASSICSAMEGLNSRAGRGTGACAREHRLAGRGEDTALARHEQRGAGRTLRGRSAAAAGRPCG